MPKERKHWRRLLDLINDKDKGTFKGKDLRCFEKKAKRVKGLLEFIKEEFKKQESYMINLLKFLKEELKE